VKFHHFLTFSHYCLTRLPHFSSLFPQFSSLFPQNCSVEPRFSSLEPRPPHSHLTRASLAPCRIFLAFASPPPRPGLTRASQNASLLPHPYFFREISSLSSEKKSHLSSRLPRRTPAVSNRTYCSLVLEPFVICRLLLSLTSILTCLSNKLLPLPARPPAAAVTSEACIYHCVGVEMDILYPSRDNS
jgi:hypothetical protein